LVLRFTRVIVIKAPAPHFIFEMSAMKQLSGAANIVSVPPEELGQEN
jgi:hypothetical protein